MKKPQVPTDEMIDLKLKKLEVSREQILLHWSTVKLKIMQKELDRDRANSK